VAGTHGNKSGQELTTQRNKTRLHRNTNYANAGRGINKTK